MKLNTLRLKISTLTILLYIFALAYCAQGQNAKGWKVIGPGGGGTTYDPMVSPHDSWLVV